VSDRSLRLGVPFVDVKWLRSDRRRRVMEVMVRIVLVVEERKIPS